MKHLINTTLIRRYDRVGTQRKKLVSRPKTGWCIRTINKDGGFNTRWWWSRWLLWKELEVDEIHRLARYAMQRWLGDFQDL